MGSEIEAVGGGPGVYLSARRARRAAAARAELREKDRAAEPSFAPAIDARSAAIVEAARAARAELSVAVAHDRLYDRARDYGARAMAREVSALRDALRGPSSFRVQPPPPMRGEAAVRDEQFARQEMAAYMGSGSGSSDVASARAVVMARLRAGLDYLPQAIAPVQIPVLPPPPPPPQSTSIRHSPLAPQRGNTASRSPPLLLTKAASPAGSLRWQHSSPHAAAAAATTTTFTSGPSLEERLSSLALERLGTRIEAILNIDPAQFAKSTVAAAKRVSSVHYPASATRAAASATKANIAGIGAIDFEEETAGSNWPT